MTNLRGLVNQLTLVGTDDQIKTQISLLYGIATILETSQKGLDLNFERFINIFEEGFFNTHAKAENPVYAKYWGLTQSTRPKVKILQELKAATDDSWSNQGYYLIEFQPNRKDVETSRLLFGTPAQLIQQLMQQMNEYIQGRNDTDTLDALIAAIEREPNPYSNLGFPKVKLIFLENYFAYNKRLSKSNKVTRGEAHISFRLMARTNGSITKQDILKLATDIKNKFVQPLFVYTKGKELYTIESPSIGKKVYCWAKDLKNATKVFEQVLDLVGEGVDRDRIRLHKPLQPNTTYKDNPGTTRIAGEVIRKEALRPIVDVEFNKAYIAIEGLRKPIYLVSRDYKQKAIQNFY